MATKGELRKQRQAEHAARETARLAAGDTRNARQRQADAITAAAKAARKAKRKQKRTAAKTSLQRAEENGGLIGGYELDEPWEDGE